MALSWPQGADGGGLLKERDRGGRAAPGLLVAAGPSPDPPHSLGPPSPLSSPLWRDEWNAQVTPGNVSTQHLGRRTDARSRSTRPSLLSKVHNVRLDLSQVRHVGSNAEVRGLVGLRVYESSWPFSLGKRLAKFPRICVVKFTRKSLAVYRLDMNVTQGAVACYDGASFLLILADGRSTRCCASRSLSRH
jgi:hypothetical protein